MSISSSFSLSHIPRHVIEIRKTQTGLKTHLSIRKGGSRSLCDKNIFQTCSINNRYYFDKIRYIYIYFIGIKYRFKFLERYILHTCVWKNKNRVCTWDEMHLTDEFEIRPYSGKSCRKRIGYPMRFSLVSILSFNSAPLFSFLFLCRNFYRSLSNHVPVIAETLPFHHPVPKRIFDTLHLSPWLNSPFNSFNFARCPCRVNKTRAALRYVTLRDQIRSSSIKRGKIAIRGSHMHRIWLTPTSRLPDEYITSIHWPPPGRRLDTRATNTPRYSCRRVPNLNTLHIFERSNSTELKSNRTETCAA